MMNFGLRIADCGFKNRARLVALALVFFIPQSAIRTPQLQAAEALQEITVKPGDTLWAIANRYLQNPQKWPEILKHNKSLSNDPTVALPGMKLQVPVMLIKESLRAVELTYILNDVRYRRRQDNAWKPAEKNMKLFVEDGIRTMTQSAARLKFPTGEVVSLSENSLVLIRPEKEGDAVQLLSGDVRAGKARVITAAGANIDPLDPNTDYRTRVKLDKSELVLVYRGRVDVTAQGKTVRVTEGFGSEIKPLAPPTDPIPLPQVPKIYTHDAPLPTYGPAVVRTLKSEDATVVSVELPETSKAAGKKSTGAQAVSAQSIIQLYRLQVADNPKISNPIVDRTYPLSEKLNLLRLGLSQGTYWWQIAFVDSFGLESSFSEPRSFQVDLTPPLVSILTPAEGTEVESDAETITITGQTEPGTKIVANGTLAEVTLDGRFAAKVRLREGKNRIVVKGEDAGGNSVTAERVVYRLMPGEQGKFKRVAKKYRRDGDDEEEAQKANPLAAFAFSVLSIGIILGVIVLIIA